MISAIFFVLGSLNFVPDGICEQVAEKVVSVYHENALVSQKLTFLDAEGEANVRAYVYELSEASLDRARVWDADEERWGVDRYATIVLGARYCQDPLIEISNALPAWIANRERAVQRASSLWSGLNPQLSGYIWLAPLDEWFEFTTSEGKRYIGAYDMLVYDMEKLTSASSQDARVLSLNVHPGWKKIESGGFLLASQNKVEDVPYALWSYGCSPTASSMVLDYWDRRGYPKLVDFYFDRWDNVEQENDKDLTNVHRELALGMHTDSMYSGSTGIPEITPGNLYAANTVNGYSFTGSTIGGDNPAVYGAIIGEIDAARPVHWSVGNYDYNGEKINHSICAVGYEITSANDSLVVLHNTWDKAEHRWTYQTSGSSSVAYPLIPGGAQEEDLRLTSLNTTTVLYKGIKYAVTFEKAGSLSEIKVWGAEDDRKSDWSPLATVPGTDNYALVGLSDGLVGSRINVEGYSGSILDAADGTASRIATMDFPQNPHFTLKGHVPANGSSSAKVILHGSVAYVAQGNGGLRVVKLASDYLAQVNNLTSHAADYLARDGDWLYVLGGKTLYLYDLTLPEMPALADSLVFTQSYGALAAYEGYAYLGRIGSELEVARRDGARLFGDVALPETLVTALDVIGVELYVSAHREGVNIYSLSSGSPQFERSVPTKGAAAGVARTGNTLYVAEGGAGVEVIDLGSGATGVFDPGSVYNLVSTDTRVYLACGQDGLIVCKISSPLALEQLGELKTPNGSVQSVALGEGELYLGCGFDGFMAFSTDLSGIEEKPAASGSVSINLMPLTSPGVSLGTIRIGANGRVAISAYDVTGRRVMSTSAEFEAGSHSLPDLPRGVAGGVYFVKVDFGVESRSGRVVLVK